MKKQNLCAMAVAVLCGAYVPVAVAETLYAEMPAGVYEVDKTHASITWKVSHLGLADYTARFSAFDAALDFKPNAPEQSTLNVTIDPRSIRTDYPYPEKDDFDAKLAEGEGWFNAKAFPAITFVSQKIVLEDGANSGTVSGDLTFLGVTKPVTLMVTLNGAMVQQPFTKKPTLGFSATTTLARSEWGMDLYIPNIGDNVEILIEAEFGMKGDDNSAE